MRPREDPYLLPRWEPGGLPTDDFIVGLSIELNRARVP